jgi:hypothetical protein
MGNVPASRATLIAGALQKLRAELDLETQESAVPTRTAPPQECVTEIGDERLARVDALAARLGVSRDEMLARCIARGLDEIEANRTRTGDRGQGG